MIININIQPQSSMFIALLIYQNSLKPCHVFYKQEKPTLKRDKWDRKSQTRLLEVWPLTTDHISPIYKKTLSTHSNPHTLQHSKREDNCWTETRHQFSISVSVYRIEEFYPLVAIYLATFAIHQPVPKKGKMEVTFCN